MLLACARLLAAHGFEAYASAAGVLPTSLDVLISGGRRARLHYDERKRCVRLGPVPGTPGWVRYADAARWPVFGTPAQVRAWVDRQLQAAAARALRDAAGVR